MKDLIPIQENNGKKAVNARELHIFLESKQEFANWIKNRIKQYAFVEGQDYQKLCFDYRDNLLNIRDDNFIKSENQQVSKIEYALSINMAKELSMVEGNEKGLEFGENEVCPKNVLETQPHYYDDKFDELLEKLLVMP